MPQLLAGSLTSHSLAILRALLMLWLLLGLLGTLRSLHQFVSHILDNLSLLLERLNASLTSQLQPACQTCREEYSEKRTF